MDRRHNEWGSASSTPHRPGRWGWLPPRPASARTPPMGRACIIGAGSSGIAACQVLGARGIPFDCFESGSDVGGNWRYNNDNGMSSAYLSLHAKSSRRCLQYAALPMPDDYPDYLSHELIAKYLDNFVDHFGFRGNIQFRTEVIKARPATAAGAFPSANRDTGACAPSDTQRCWSPTVTTGIHSIRSRPFPALRPLPASRFIRTITARRNR